MIGNLLTSNGNRLVTSPSSTTIGLNLPFRLFPVVVLFASVVSALMDAATEATPFLYYTGFGMSAILTCLVLILPSRYKIYPFLVLLVNVPDLTQSTADIDTVGYIRSASFWQFKIGPINSSWILFFLVAVFFISLPRKRFTKLDRIFAIYFTTIPVVTCFVYGYAFSGDYGAIITDLKLPLLLFMGIQIFSSYTERYPMDLQIWISFFLALILGRFLIDAIYLLGGVMRTQISGMNRVSVDSGKGLLMVVVFFVFYEIQEGRKRILNGLFFSLSLFLLISYQTRLLPLAFFLGLPALFYCRNKGRIILTLLVLSLVGSLTMWLLHDRYSYVLDITEQRFSLPAIQSHQFDLETLDPVRVTAIVNGLHTLIDSFAVLTGMGYGSWYSDEYRAFTSTLRSAYSDESVMEGHFYRIHDAIFHIIFKHGLIGLLIYLCIYTIPLVNIFRLRDVWTKEPKLNRIVLVILSLYPTIVLYFFWTSKLILLGGIYIALLRLTLRLIRERSGLLNGRILRRPSSPSGCVA
ncbi:MAG: hypothetical protein AAGU75_06735 [Bacillota bacterium]